MSSSNPSCPPSPVGSTPLAPSTPQEDGPDEPRRSTRLRVLTEKGRALAEELPRLGVLGTSEGVSGSGSSEGVNEADEDGGGLFQSEAISSGILVSQGTT